MRHPILQKSINGIVIILLLAQTLATSSGQTLEQRDRASSTGQSKRMTAPRTGLDSTDVAGKNEVSITDDGFVPQVITVTVGTEVTWVNNGTIPHGITVLGADKVFSIFLPLITKNQAGADSTVTRANSESMSGILQSNAVASPGWTSGLLLPGQSATRAFNEVGIFEYEITDDPNLTGKVVVEPANQPPSISISTPSEGAIVAAGDFLVTGNVSDDGQVVELLVNDIPAQVTGNYFEVTINLQSGNQTILAKVKDDEGALGADTVIVLVDGEGPSIEIATPRDRQVVYSTQPFLDILYSDFGDVVETGTLQASLTRQGQGPIDIKGDLTISADRAYGTVSSLLTEDSVYTLTISIDDSLGNNSLASTTFYVPVDADSLIAPVEIDGAGWVSGMVYDSSTCDLELTECLGLPGAFVTVEEVNVQAMADYIAQRQAQTMARLSSSAVFEPLGPSNVTNLTTVISGTAVTGPDGFFAFPLDQTGVYWLRVEKDGFTYGQRELQVVRERSSTANDIYLTPLDPVVTPCDSGGCEHTNSDGSLVLDIPAGAIAGGDSVNVTATNFRNVEFLPSGELPAGTWETYAFNLGGASEITFTVPITVQVKNTLGFTPGLIVPLGYWNQATQSWEHEGTGVVDGTGQWIETNISHFSNHDLNFPVALSDVEVDTGGDEFDPEGERDLPGDEEDEPCGEGASGCFINYKSGTLHEWIDTPAVSIMGQPQGQRLTYSSDRANPSEVIDVRVSLKNTGSIQSYGYMGYELYIQGEKTATHYFPVDLTQEGELGRLRYFWDGRNAQGDLLPAGAYQYQVKLTFPYLAEYCRPVGNIFGNEPDCVNGGTDRFVPAVKTIWRDGTVTLHGDPENPLGIGWALGGMQRLYETEAGDILIVDGQRHDEFYFPQKDQLREATAALNAASMIPTTSAETNENPYTERKPESWQDSMVTPVGPTMEKVETALPIPNTTRFSEQLTRGQINTSSALNVCGAINSNMTWTSANNPHVVTCDVSVQPGVTLTIEPGVIVQFQPGLSLAVSGNLVAQGLEGSAINFESAGAQAPASWEQIAFLPGSSGVLNWVTVKHGGFNPASTAQYGAVTIASSDVTISNAHFQQNGVAVYVAGGSDLTISDSLFIGNTAYYGGAINARDLTTLTIKDSEFNFNQAGRRGGAIFATEADLDIHGSRFFSNTTTNNYGGALAIDWYASADIFDNHFENNQSNGGGGGAIFIYNEMYQTTIISNTFLNNEAVNREGGAIYDESHQTIIKDNTFSGSKGRDGGAITHLDYFYTPFSALIESNIFLDGRARNGAGLHVSNGDPDIRNNIFANNIAETSGGAIQTYSPINLEYNVLWNNRAQYGGGLVNYSTDGLIRVNNNIIVSNTATYNNGGYLGGGGINNGTWYTGIPVGDHNLVWGNAGLDYQDTIPGPNDIAADPLFVDPTNLDFHLQPGSPAIDAGSQSELLGDFDGDFRPMGLGPDIGADEYLAFGVAKESSSSLVEPGEYLTYTIYVVNVDNISTSASLTDELPQEFTFIGYDSPLFSCNHDGAAWGGALTCSGDIGANSQAMVTVTVMADSQPPEPVLTSNIVTASNGSESSQDSSDVWLSWCAAQLKDGPILDSVQEAIDSSFSNDPSELIKVSGRCFVPWGVGTFGRTIQGGWNRDFSIRLPGLYTTTLDAEYKGAVVSLQGAATLEGFVITNGADGGVYATGNAIVRNNIIEHNIGGDTAGGIYAANAATIRHNIIRYNQAEDGGGITVRTEDINLLIDSNIISENSSVTGAGGMLVVWSGRIRNNIFYNNHTDGSGGGLSFNSRNRAPIIEHNTFYGNSAAVRGGALGLGSNFGWRFDTVIRNNAVISNTAPDGGGIFLTSPMNGLDYNNVWGNTPNEYNTGTITPTNSISANPLFVDALSGDFHLTAGSPMIDAADPLVDYYPDFEGDPRPMGDGGSDIGADEYPSPTAFSRTATDYSRLEYDPGSNTYTRYYLDGTVVHFDDFNRHDYTLAPDGTRTTYSYNNDSTVAWVSVSAPGEATPDWTWTFAYTSGKLSGITDPAGRVTSFSINGRNHLTAATLPDGSTQSFTYNWNGLLSQHRDENGNVTDFHFDDYGRTNQIVDPVREVYDPQTRTAALLREVRAITPSDTSYPLLNNRTPGSPDFPGAALPLSDDLVERIVYGRGELSGRTDRWGFWASQTDGLGRTTATIRNLDGSLKKTIYPDGDCVEYTYDERGNRLSESRMGSDQCILAPGARDPGQVRTWSWTYESRFNMVKSETDPNGHTTDFTYDYEVGGGDAGRVVEITHPEVDDGYGNMVRPVEQFYYNKWGLIEVEVDPMGTATRYVYTQGTAEEASNGAKPLFAPGVTPVPGHLTQVIRDYGGEHLADRYKEFDSAGNPGLTIGPGGHNTTAYVYDEMNRVIQESDAVDVVTTYVYDGRGNLVQQVVDSGGRNVTSNFDYNANDQVIKQVIDDGDVLVGTTIKYDINRQPVLHEDGRGAQKHYLYDEADQLVNMIDAAGHVVTNTFGLNGKLSEFANTSGNITRHEYDPFNQRITETVDAGGLNLVTGYRYDLKGNQTTMSDPTGTVTCFEFDALDRLIAEIRDCGGQALTTTYSYDLNGNLLRQTDHRGVVTRHEYDAINREIRMILDDGNLSLVGEYQYDSAGNIERITDERGYVHEHIYDNLNRLVQLCKDVTGLNLCTSYTYDTLGNVDTVTDAAGVTTRTIFNGFGQPLVVIDDDGGLAVSTRYTYDNVLNLRSIEDANGAVTNYEYTLRKLLAMERFADGSAVSYDYEPRGYIALRVDQDNNSVSFEYDGAGRLATRTISGGGTQFFAYDLANRLSEAQENMNGHLTIVKVGYNALGNIITTTQAVDGKSWLSSYEYDYQSGVYSLTYPSGELRVRNLEPLGRLANVRDGSGVVIADYAYQDQDGIGTISYANGVVNQTEYDAIGRITRSSSDVGDYQYGYDSAGNKTYMQRAHAPGQPADVYEYDPLYRPVQVWYGADATDPVDITSAESHLQFSLDPLNNRLEVLRDGNAEVYGPSDGSQLTNIMNRYEEANGQTLTYDDRGNTLSDGDNTYTYDNLNRQIGLDGPGGTTEYVYDALDRRVAKIVDGVVTYYIYDIDTQVIEERAFDDSLLVRFTYGMGIDQPLMMERAGETFFYHRDAQSSITELTDASGLLVESYSYDIYGTPHLFDETGLEITTSNVDNPYLYTGRRYDPESGNYYFRARLYSPTLGRFLQMDPIGYVDGMNLYASYFVLNDTDPSGLSTTVEVLSAGLYAGVGGGISIEVDFDFKDCCFEGEKIRDGRRKYTIKGSADVGLGIGGKIWIGGMGLLDLGLRGPKLAGQATVVATNSRCNGPVDTVEYCRNYGINTGGSGSLGAFGVTLQFAVKMQGDLKLCGKVTGQKGTFTANLCYATEVALNYQIGPFKGSIWKPKGYMGELCDQLYKTEFTLPS